MSQRYSGGIITASPTTPTMTTEGGVWTLEQQFQYASTWSPEIVGNSLRFRSSASAYLNRTPASAGNRTKWTFSFWVKRGTLSSNQFIYSAQNAGTADDNIGFISDTFRFRIYDGGATIYDLTTTQVFRDPSAWYHVVLAFDTTQATSSNRMKMYVNGSQITTFGTATYPPLNYQSPGINNNIAQNIGRYATGSSYFDGYMAEVYFVDGQALAPTSFGAFDTNGVWQPLAYTGTFGTNGFYVDFTDNSAATAAALGKDYSGNGNNWTPNNISLTAGTAYDWMLDSPTNWTNGSTVVGNYAVLNPLRQNGSATFAQGNLAGTSESGTSRGLCSTIVLPRSDKWYMEWTPSSSTTNWFGVTANDILASDINTAGQQSVLYYASNGNKWVNGTSSAYGASYTTNTIGVAFDGPGGTITFYKDNVSQGAITLPSSTVDYVFCMGNAGGGGVTNYANFGQRPFTYTPPTGFKALCTQNLSTPNITNGAQYFAATTYTGTGAAQNILNSANTTTGVSFKPDLVWIKSRSVSGDTEVYDSVRGATKYLLTDSTLGEGTIAQSVTAFNSNGFALGTGSGGNDNTNGTTYIGWQWQAGQGTTSSNTSGSITSTVSVNATAGFSVVTYTGTGANATVGHGLGVAPKMVIVKNRTGAANNWPVYHAGLTSAAYAVRLNTTAAQASAAWWNSTAPTSTVFSLGTETESNTNGNTYVAYCFAAIAGYSAFGSYTGNGSADGAFVYLGFRPRFVMFKRTDTTSNWLIIDSSRGTYNSDQNRLFPNLSNAEDTSENFDLLSNGFKLRDAAGSMNASGGTYIYAAFAENPFQNARAR